MYFSFSYRPYIVIIGDIRNSRMLEQRGNAQEQLQKVLQTVNEKYAFNIAAKFMITLGDEFQGLLDCGEHTMDIIEEIQAMMHPIRIRFGIGIGAVATKINPEATREIDGSCYYKAREAIDYLKQNEKRYQNSVADIRMEIEEDTFGTATLMNTTFSLMSVLEQNWTDGQRRIIYDFSYHQDGQEKCAKRLGIAQSSVQRGLMNSNYYSYAQALQTINNILGEIQKNDI